MAAVNWDVTEKVINKSCHTVTLTNNVIQKSYVVRTTTSTVQDKTECYILKFFNFVLQNFH